VPHLEEEAITALDPGGASISISIFCCLEYNGKKNYRHQISTGVWRQRGGVPFSCSGSQNLEAGQRRTGQWREAHSTWKPANGAPGNGEKLTLYANYKQAKEGDCGATPRPGMFDPTGRAKWDAWAGLKGKTVEQARADYVAEVKRQKAVYGTA
jgi:diazepam-binding inhibitor (GABA receptor modulating acyl-CoA-binding protein)